MAPAAADGGSARLGVGLGLGGLGLGGLLLAVVSAAAAATAASPAAGSTPESVGRRPGLGARPPTTTPSRAPWMASTVRPAWLGATAAISSRIWSADSTPRSAPSRRASSAASIQSSRAVPGGVILRATVLTRPSRLVVVPSVSAEPAGGEHDVGLLRRGGEEAVDRDHRAGAGEAARGEVGVGEVGERVGAEQDEHVDLAVGGGLQDAGGVEARARRGPSAHRVA